MEVLKLTNVSRDFDVSKKISSTKKINAVNNISFSVSKGEIVGLLGPNGAGKSTTIKMMTTVLHPTSGKVEICGLNSFTDRKEIRKKINVVFGGERGLYWKLTGYENLMYFAQLYQMPKKEAESRIGLLLEEFGLTEFKNLPVGKYSSGMKQKIHFVRALLNDPEILFLDEPTNAMDPKTAMQVRGIVREYNKKGKTILIATHNMYEADELCDRIIIMNKGVVAQNGTPDELKQYIKTEKIRIVIEGHLQQRELESLETPNATLKMEDHLGKTIIEIIGQNLNQNFYLENLLSLKVTIKSIQDVVPELEEVYIRSISDEREA